ncbi:MAG: polysaccharide deacetylase [Alphaproteobacteria bacterium]|nr:MAG: polysaccharide deacetylase [Alphaproteobacteria bacterium]
MATRMVLDALYFSGVQTASRFWMGGLGGILMLHRVADRRQAGGFRPNAHLTVTPAFLDRVIGVLKRRGFRFVTMDGLVDELRSYDARRWHDPLVAITLDDGYRDNLENAVPIFRRYEVPYTIYVAPGLVDGRATLWWEDLEQVIGRRERFVLHSPKGHVEFDVATPAAKRRVFDELCRFLTRDVDEDQQRKIVAELAWQAGVDPEANRAAAIMNWREIVELASDPLCTIGAHTVHHFALARLPDRRVDAEMVESMRILKMELGELPRHFAYPYGYPQAAGAREFRLAREAGFVTAVTTRHGVVYPGHAAHLHALPRISLNGNFQAMRYVDTLLSGLPTRIQNRGAAMSVT